MGNISRHYIPKDITNVINYLCPSLYQLVRERETWKYTPQVSMYTPQNEVLPHFRQVTGNVIEIEERPVGVISPAARLGLGKTEEMPMKKRRVERTSLTF